MKQSRFMSGLETVLSTAAGFGLSLLIQWLVLGWLLGVEIPLHTNLLFAAIMTVASLVRGFVLRRIFEALHIRVPMSSFATAVLSERLRQKTGEGWDDTHDDGHPVGELARAGAAYALWNSGYARGSVRDQIWPWDGEWWKPAGFRRDLVRAAALILAEGEKFDRNRKRK